MKEQIDRVLRQCRDDCIRGPLLMCTPLDKPSLSLNLRSSDCKPANQDCKFNLCSTLTVNPSWLLLPRDKEEELPQIQPTNDSIRRLWRRTCCLGNSMERVEEEETICAISTPLPPLHVASAPPPPSQAAFVPLSPPRASAPPSRPRVASATPSSLRATSEPPPPPRAASEPPPSRRPDPRCRRPSCIRIASGRIRVAITVTSCIRVTSAVAGRIRVTAAVPNFHTTPTRRKREEPDLRRLARLLNYTR
uniref:Uncharacterized protein n=1 Tax=Oryza rufipogon TaxID=4529 RepID=A0A0E0PWU1_ORYRU